MKVVGAFFLSMVVLAILVGSLLWMNRTSVLAHFLAKHLGVPVRIEILDISSQRGSLSHLWIGNPPRSKTPTSFQAGQIDITSSLEKLRGDPLTIDEILIRDIFVGIEFYAPQETNWSHILGSDKKKASKNYLIKSLVLENLTVQLMKVDGSIQRFPTIARMEFHNLTNETGIPIQEIEKVIFRQMMQEIFKKFKLNDFLQNLPKKVSPWNLFSLHGEDMREGVSSVEFDRSEISHCVDS